MSATLRDLLDTFEAMWPAGRAESWDSVGLVTGDPAAPVSRILLAVDAVDETIVEAEELGADLLVTHHPVLLRGVHTIAETTAKGNLLARLVRAGCALMAAHTNADVVERGTSDELARRLRLVDTEPIEPAADDATLGLGRVGRLPEPLTLGALAITVAKILPATATGVRVAGDFDAEVERIAVCGGAGDSFLADPAVVGADVYITSDLRHHPASEAREQARLAGGRPFLVDTSHWASEWLFLDGAAEELRRRHPDVEVVVSERNTDPWDFAVPQ
ncbi:Nif3-like dinuclear metal center hexameric protein [Pseudoclavibacter chungangensis]|uniref:GTP cyclohydrolase 1 type 2 homolog n=1 Tax=Pseudoclavibacter chungangensis TaxID=587635 RepID=A0A7J5BSE9_9MICO|nr:Nif3-like dinuclear metal center hexameric protein [Pseudoclavibacter chungangensis]KAB1655975.1 Nif3-like dinuclear metal center hexameric protein [Pseudoclavibacter chungangensis]NYJ66422.1 dinuclear metal center YbgI/SA1388 family protein [Pseudoclavibacter chungangensis]